MESIPMKTICVAAHSRDVRSTWLIGLAFLTCIPLVSRAQAPADKEPQKGEQQNSAAKSAGDAPSADSAQAASRDQRLQKIEEQLRVLLDEVEKLRKAKTGDASAQASPSITLDSKWTQALTWRSIGPAGMGGRIVDFAVVDSDPNTYWVATASGGLLKTTNNGTTFVHQFDHEATVSIGCVSVAPSDPNIVWVGTGENNPRNSVSYGDGAYKSTDGGKTWKNMGLGKSFQVGRIAIHRTNPDIVYVGALGRLYGPNEERGLYKTTDGGKTWERVLYVDDKTGVIDMRMHPTESDTLLVAMWERQRDGYDSHPGGGMEDGFDSYDPIKKWGPGAGIYKTTDGGKNWHKLTKGLPTNKMGRIGLDYYRKDPNTVFAIIDCEKIGMGTPPKTGANIYIDVFGEDAEGGLRLVRVREGGPSAKAGLAVGDIVQSIDDRVIAASEQLFDAIRAHKVGDKIKYKVLREGAPVEITVMLERRPEVTGGEGNVYLGIAGEDAEKGVRITRLMEGGPAAAAGLKNGDIVESIGGKEVKDYNQLLDEVRGHKPGDKVKFEIRRDEKRQELEVTLAERPAGGRGARGGGPMGEGPGGPSKTRPSGYMYAGQMENVQDEQGPNSFEYGGIYKSTDGGESWQRINSLNPRPMYFSQVRVDPSDDKNLYVCGVSLYRSNDGGKTFRADAGRNVHADQHAMWIDSRDGRHMLVGCDGGFYATYDRAANWDHLNTMAIGQFYHVAICPKQPYYVAGGLQDNGSWCGPTVSLDGAGPINEDWISVGGGDGFVCRVDPSEPDLIYSESQGGMMSRRNTRTGERAVIRPARPDGAPPYRFNWNTPFILSSHNSRILYCGGNYVFRSVDRGNNLQIISPEITLTKQGSATAIAESPKNPDVLYAGTDDGALWITHDGGKTWTEISKNVGLAGPRWVATIEPSRFVEGRAYVVFDGHRSNDDEPFPYLTEDFGKTWKSLRANLPWGSTRCLREDLVNPNLLYLGTEFGAWCSLDRGKSWSKLGGNLPTVAVHEFALHPTTGEVVAATHGRSLWVLDISALRQLKPENLADKPALYEPTAIVRWRGEPIRGGTNRRFIGQNPQRGAQLYYSLPKKAEKVELKIVDISGATLRELPVSKEAGLYRITWDLRPGTRPGNAANGSRSARSTEQTGEADRPAGESAPRRQRRGADADGGARGGEANPAGGNQSGEATTDRPRGGGFAGRRAAGLSLGPGTYRVVLTVDGKEFAQNLRVEADPIVADAVAGIDQPYADTEEEEEEMDQPGGMMEEEREREVIRDVDRREPEVDR
jgi:photosystem II stability/assembly factor-like uncharacterized protein